MTDYDSVSSMAPHTGLSRPDRRFFRTVKLAVAAAGASACLSLGAQEAEEDVVVLSPFEVDGSRDTGYYAENTLSGTRLNSSIKDVASAQSVLTKEFLDDIAATSFEDALAFAPNAGADEGGITDDPLGNRGLFFNSYRIRGFRLDEGLTTDFLQSEIPGDVYNIQRITLSRGPNSILFGLGSPGGNANQVSKRALLNKNRNEVSVRLDSDDSKRATLDVNRVLVEGKLAVRAASVVEERFTHRKPSGRDQYRYYFNLNYKPTKTTSIRAQWETGEIDQMNVRPWTTTDSFSAWRDAGSNTVDTPRTINNGNVVAGVEPVSNGIYGLVIPGIDPQNWQRMGRSALPPRAFRNRQNLASISNGDDLPLEINPLGGGQSVDIDFSAASLFFEQKLAEGLFFEAVYSKQQVRRDVFNTIGANFDRVFIDPNSVLPDGTPNPNLGRFYIETANSTRFLVESDIETLRATTSYETDLSRKFGEFGENYLGKLRMAGLVERRSTQSYRPIYRLHDTATVFQPAAQAIRNPFAGANRIRHRFYIDPENGVYGAPKFGDNYPTVYGSANAADNFPAPDPDNGGLGLAWMPASDLPAPIRSLQELDSQMLAVQSYFWDNRLIAILGWRSDELDIWEGDRPGTDIFSFSPNPNAGFWENLREIDPETRWADLRRDNKGSTRTRGLVYRPIRDVSLYYNESSSFSPVTAGFTDIRGNDLVNTRGEGEDYGIRYTTPDGKTHLNLNFFKTDEVNARSPQVGSPAGTGIAIFGNLNTMWRILGEQSDLTDRERFLEAPFLVQTSRQGYVNSTSEGMELSVTSNPTKSWRLHFNLSRQENFRSVFGPETQAYLDEFLPFLSDPTFRDFIPNPDAMDTTGQRTFGELYDDLVIARSRLNSLEGAIDGRRPEWSFNATTAYRFREGAAKGLTLGGNARWRDAAVIGYPNLVVDGFSRFDIDNPYMGDETINFGVFGRYTRKIFDDKVNWVIQLNINNLLDDDDLVPFEAVDNGNGEFISRWSLPRGRTFVLSNTLTF